METRQNLPKEQSRWVSQDAVCDPPGAQAPASQTSSAAQSLSVVQTVAMVVIAISSFVARATLRRDLETAEAAQALEAEAA